MPTDIRNPAQKRFDAALDAMDRRRYLHKVKGEYYGPSLTDESLADYRKRVQKAYGSLAGVTFHDKVTKELAE